MKLTFVNHACCKLIAGDIGLLFDPWIDGSAFNEGWDLLIPTPLSLDAIMAGITISGFRMSIRIISRRCFSRGSRRRIEDRVTVLFQPTRDHRVAQFCRDLGFRVIEMENSVPLALGRALPSPAARMIFTIPGCM